MILLISVKDTKHQTNIKESPHLITLVVAGLENIMNQLVLIIELPKSSGVYLHV